VSAAEMTHAQAVRGQRSRRSNVAAKKWQRAACPYLPRLSCTMARSRESDSSDAALADGGAIAVLRAPSTSCRLWESCVVNPSLAWSGYQIRETSRRGPSVADDADARRRNPTRRRKPTTDDHCCRSQPDAPDAPLDPNERAALASSGSRCRAVPHGLLLRCTLVAGRLVCRSLHRRPRLPL